MAMGSPNIWALGWIILRLPSGPGAVGAAEWSVTNEGNKGVYEPLPPWAECSYDLEENVKPKDEVFQLHFEIVLL